MVNKNILNNSSIENNSGQIIVGDIIINLGNSASYGQLTENISTKKKKRLECLTELEIEKKKLNSNEENKTLNRLIEILSEHAVNLSEEIDTLQQQEKEFRINIIKFVTLYLQESSTTDDLNSIELLLKEGKFDTISQELDLKELISEKVDAQKLKNKADEKLKKMAKKFLLKARAEKLNINNPNRYTDTYIAYWEALDSYRDYEILLEFADFISNYNIPETINIYEEIINNFSKDLTEKNKAKILEELGFSQCQERRLDDALSNYQQALDIYEEINIKSVLLSLDLFDKIASCYSVIATIYLQMDNKDKADEYYDKALDVYKGFDIKIKINMQGYSAILTNYFAYFVWKDEKIDINTAYKFIDEMFFICNNMPKNDDNKRSVATAFHNVAYLQYNIGDNKNAIVNICKAKNIVYETDDLYNNQTLVALIPIYQLVARIYESEDDIRNAIFYIKEGIRLSKMLFGFSKQSSMEMAAMFSIELADYEHKRKNDLAYLEAKRTALDYYKELHNDYPKRGISGINVTYRKLILHYIPNGHNDKVITHFSDLITLLNSCKQHNPALSSKFDCIIVEAKITLALFYKYVVSDRNLSSQIFISIFELIGTANDVDICFENNRQITLLELMKDGIDKIIVNGKVVRIGEGDRSQT